MKAIKGLAGASFILVAFGGAAQANLITNGSFETGNFSPVDMNDTVSLPAGSTNITGWTVIGQSGSLVWIGPSNPFGLTATNGDYFLDLQGYSGSPPYGGVSQSLTTTPGATYLVTFDLGSSPQWGLQDGLTVYAGSASQVFNSTNSGTQRNRWESESFGFTATGTSPVLTFQGKSGLFYIGLDNVDVTQTSAPGAPGPAPGVGLLGLTSLLLGWAATKARLSA